MNMVDLKVSLPSFVFSNPLSLNLNCELHVMQDSKKDLKMHLHR